MIEIVTLAAGAVGGIAYTLAGLLACVTLTGPATLMRQLGLEHNVAATLLALIAWPALVVLGVIAQHLQARRPGATYRPGRI